MDYPAAERLDLVEDIAGTTVADPYRWLEDPADPRTAEWAAAQDALAASHLDGLPGREHLRGRITDLLKAGVVGAPSWRGDRSFFVRRSADQEHAVVVVREGDGSERILLDPMAIDPTGMTTLDSWQPDKEGRRLAYQLSTGGDEESALRVMLVDTGEVIDGPIDRIRYSPVGWLVGGDAFYYVRRLPPESVPADEAQYHRRLWLHRVGTDAADDVLIFGDDQDKTAFFGGGVSTDGRWLVVSATEGTAPRNDVWIADLHATGPERPALVPVQVGVDAQTGLHVGRDGRLYVHTNRDAPRGRLCVASPEDPSYENWVDLVPEDGEAVLEDFAILDDTLLVEHTRHAVSELAAHDLATGELRAAVALPGLGSIGGLSERPEGGSEAWFGYTDHVTPPQVLRYDAADGSVSVWATPPGTVETPVVHARQDVYTSRDGTQVRLFVLSSEKSPSGPRPTILYGYGGFGIPMTPGYSSTALAWVEAGGVYAVACLRGGAEEGDDWHRAGMRQQKQNVFDDFHAAAEHLIATGWTTPDQLGISGGSNGGLLVGAAVTQRPDLFTAVVCSAPLLDMVRYELHGLGQLWSTEYGSAADPSELAALHAYSPYHNVREGVDYPSVLFTVFDSDTRVDPLHARKMCAALQHATSGDRPILYRREADVGHGARSVTRSVGLSVDTMAYLASRTGLSIGDS
ncbi:MAG: prolyl oligopeptidase [Frankiaceae bacterium]|nr:prolyl oligopeptidase [Frankiaceae bacterium]